MARCVPAASSATLMADIAIWSGRDSMTTGSCQSTTTEVSSSPDATSDALVDDAIDVGPELMRVDPDA